ncbi:MAG: hypothetical protein AAB400_03530 [Patescibacteria group bacterium]
MLNTPSATGASTASGTGTLPVLADAQTGYLDPAPGSTDAQHRADEELEKPEKDPPLPPPPPPLPPGPSRERDYSSGDETWDDESRLSEPFGALPEGLPPTPDTFSIAASIAELGNLPDIPERLQEIYRAQEGKLMKELAAFEHALENEADAGRLQQLLDALEIFRKAFEHGVGAHHYRHLTSAVLGRDYKQIALYMKVLKELIDFKEA